MQSVFLDQLQGKTTNRPPVWFMRQAGRILPRYRELKANYSFAELMNDPQLAAKVTLLPVEDLGVDAAILFSDILVIPNAMGMELEFTDQGPVFRNPLNGFKNPVNQLNPDPQKLEYIYAVIDEIQATRPENTPLIGFCGAPLTTLCYMIQGISSNPNFPDAMKFLFQHKKAAQDLIDAIANFSIHYAQQQIKHGIHAFQLFETHAGLIPATLYEELILPAVRKISMAVRSENVPFIFFPKGLGTGLRAITPAIADFVSIDWQMSLDEARKLVDPAVGLQGNLDPRLLYASAEEITAELKKLKPFFQKNSKWIFNLGHGFLPDIPFEHARLVVDWIKQTNWQD